MSAVGPGNASSTTSNPSSTQNPGQTYATGAPSDGGGVSTQSSALYLFTFLATLLMLMFVSFAIVLRSFIMRRQFRRRLDDAIAHGYIFSPPSPSMGFQRALGEKPKIWHRWILPSTDVYWQDIKPISASLLLNSATTNEKHEPDTTLQSPPPTRPNFLSLFKPRRRRRSTGNPPSTSPAPHSSNTPSPASDLTEPVGVEISVLISMPSCHSQSSKGKGRETDSLEDEETFPEVVFGIARVPYATESHN